MPSSKPGLWQSFKEIEWSLGVGNQLIVVAKINEVTFSLRALNSRFNCVLLGPRFFGVILSRFALKLGLSSSSFKTAFSASSP